MRHLFLLFLFLLATAAPLHSAQEPSDAASYVAYLRSDSEEVDAVAQWWLGLLYHNGVHGLAQDYVEAQKWWLKAAEQGYAPAQYDLGLLYRDGHGVAQDYVEARKWFLKAAEQGDAWAQYNLGLLYAHGRGVAQDYTMAYIWYNIAAAQGDADAQKMRDAVAAQLDPASLAEAQKLSTEYFKRYVEPFQ